MARACAPALLALALAALALAASPAAAQNSTFGETQLNGTGPVYKKQDSLDPFYANLYGIPVPKGQPDPDIYITLEALGAAGADKLGLYCNPSWGQYADVNANYPQPGYAVWQSDVANGVDTVFISRNDRLYRPPSARDVNSSLYAAYQPYFICSVINLDGQARISYRLEADLINNQSPLNMAEQQALASIYSQCCPDQPGVCVEWRAQNAEAAAAPAAAPAAALGAAAGAPAPGTMPLAAPVSRAAAGPAVAPGVVTDFCSFPGQICSTNGTMLRLDMRGFNLQCPFPVEAMTAFTGLTTINLGRNPNLTAALADVFAAVSGAHGLKHLNLYADSGLTGPMASPMTTTFGSGVCALARASLRTLDLMGVSGSGPLPACLLGTGSRLIELHMGNLNLSGPLPDVAPDSPLQVMTLYNNNLTGSLPASIGNAAQLVNLDLSGNGLTGTLPASLGNLTNLKYAVLKFNNFTGSIPSALATAQTLETLDVKGNKMTALPAEWVNGWPGSANSSLVNVRLSFNNFSGPFPTGLGAAPALTFLVINNNTFSGTLPNNTGMFPQLRAFNGSHNAFSGPLPAALGQSGIFRLSPLQFVNGEILMHVLDLSFNQLNGSLPSFLDSTSVPAQYVQKGIFLQGNNFSFACTAQNSYIQDLCPAAGAAGAPSGSAASPLLPMGIGSASASGGASGAASGASGAPGAPAGQATPLFPGTNYPVGGQSNNVPIPSPSPDTTASSSTNGNPVNINSPPPSHAGGLPTSAIIGIAVGSVLAVVLAGAALAAALLRRPRHAGPAPAPPPSLQPGKPSGSGLVGKLSNKLSSKNTGFQRFDDGVEMQNGKGGFGSHA